MRRLISIALVIVFAAFVNPVPLAVAQAQVGTVTGVATDAAKNPLANHTVRLRAVSGPQQGQILSTVQSAANGSFSVAVGPGTYVVEVVNAAGQIVGTSSSIAVAAGVTTTVTVTASAIAVGAAAAAGGAGLAGLFTGTSLVVIGIGTATLVTVAVVATQEDASPSR